MSIDELLQKPYWIIDILPKQVPQGSPGQYFSVEKYYLEKNRFAAIKQKHINLILKLNCYRDLVIRNDSVCNPPPEQIAEEMEDRTLYLLFGEAMILSEPDETYLTVFNPDNDLLDLMKDLAAGEGLFLWSPQVIPAADPLPDLTI